MLGNICLNFLGVKQDFCSNICGAQQDFCSRLTFVRTFVVYSKIFAQTAAILSVECWGKFVQTFWVRSKTFIQKFWKWWGQTFWVWSNILGAKKDLSSNLCSEARLVFIHFGCEGRHLFKHFGCKARVLFKHFGCKARMFFKQVMVEGQHRYT